MNIPLPHSVAAFFAASNRADISTLEHCFTDDAVVHDEDRVHRGHEAIRAWLREAQRRYAFTAEPLTAVERGPAVDVRAKVSGNFPGSPAELTYVFRLTGGRIEFLEIG